ncbi:Ppx/GppA family phosphatase [Roseovarius sp.]|jgi:exopolyphosphatase/guanosine-5'-triphosphate,3'-diphosphate pyrophosphatase|uniref:Ppx/GppA family phosphatase n=1 Tax=Roseovarius sp. TaxID=1486281 RepID=UPI0026294C2A|nr:Ppx/GppA family phosphatase [Roseovarius sp.]MDM8166455.1 Ppx/GppA family phosphatase [Roseovarius sp.]
MDGTNDPAETDWGPFGRPLFDEASAQGLSRVGVVDIGSNSVRLVVFDGAARSPAYFFNEKIMCALGAGMSETGRLNPEGRARALAAMRRFKHLGDGIGTDGLTAVATAAVREAEDGAEFCEEVERETGIHIHVIDGKEEARLSAQGVLLGWPGSYGLVCDIGGSSMELAEINGGRVGRRLSSSLGPLKLRDMKGGKKARKALIRDRIKSMQDDLGEQKNRLFLVGGSWRAIAKIDMERRGYPLHVLHEYRMTAKAVRETAKYIEKSDAEDLRNRAGVSSSRMALVPIASEVLREVVKTFKPRDIAISSYGIREGLLYEQMPQRLRDRDPLIEACAFAESRDARVPGYGTVVYKFIEPLFKSVRPERRRIIKAACLLHDVSWRAHPDYRAEDCFDNATRANLGGLKHSERVFLGLALLHRYSNRREGTRFQDLNTLVSEDDQVQAEVLGKAMRFAAMLWLKRDAKLGELRWFPKKKRLDLRLSPEAAPLFGEVAEARFRSLAETLQAEATIKMGQ